MAAPSGTTSSEVANDPVRRRAAVVHRRALRLCATDAPAAIALLEEAVRLDAGEPAYARNLGALYGSLGCWPEAFRVLLPLADRLDAAVQAVFLMAGRQIKEAPVALAAIEAAGDPAASEHADLLCEYGRALLAAGRGAEAQPVLLACLRGPSPPARVHDALAAFYTAAGHGDLAVAHSAEYARRSPGAADAQLRLAVGLALRGRLEESRAARLAAVRLGLSAPDDHVAVLDLMLNDTHEDGVSIRQACAAAFEPDGPRPAACRPRPPRARSTRVRVGYLSSDFAVAPGCYFLDPFLHQHDPARVELFLYDTRDKRLRGGGDYGALADRVCDVWPMDDDALARRIEADRIDVLVELSALFPDSRLAVLARRVAPVQATLPQCPTTTGCRAVDYLFTDRWTSPPGTEVEYAERLHYLPSGHVIYTPPRVCPPGGPVPSSSVGAITFGLLQRFMKIGPDVWDAIAAILRATPRSRLLLHNSDDELDRPASTTRAFLAHMLSSRGVDPGRLTCVGRLSHRAHLELVDRLDVALDTWPYSGTTTTCESLWMGVPVVTIAGRTHASRVSAALLRRMSLDGLVASDPAGYVAIATALAADGDALRDYRASLRERVIAGGLTDGRALAAGMEEAYDTWCRSA